MATYKTNYGFFEIINVEGHKIDFDLITPYLEFLTLGDRVMFVEGHAFKKVEGERRSLSF